MRPEVVFPIALAACTSSDDSVVIERTVDPCAPLALVAEAPTAIQQTGIDGAYLLWRDHGAPALGRRAGATMEIRFGEASLAFRGLYDDREGVIYVNRGIEDINVLSIVIAHELGHAFGLLHVPVGDGASVMNPGNVTVPPNAADRGALEALWGTCL